MLALALALFFLPAAGKDVAFGGISARSRKIPEMYWANRRPGQVIRPYMPGCQSRLRRYDLFQ